MFFHVFPWIFSHYVLVSSHLLCCLKPKKRSPKPISPSAKGTIGAQMPSTSLCFSLISSASASGLESNQLCPSFLGEGEELTEWVLIGFLCFFLCFLDFLWFFLRCSLVFRGFLCLSYPTWSFTQLHSFCWSIPRVEVQAAGHPKSSPSHPEMPKLFTMKHLYSYMAVGQKSGPKKNNGLVKGNIDPATCGPRLGFHFDT